MPAATWGWLKMNQTKLELSDELAAAPAEDLFIRAKLEDAALSATDERTRAAVVRLGNNLIDNFEEELA